MGGQSESCLNHLLLIQLFESRSLQAVHSTRTSKTPVKDQFYSWTCGPETECFKFLLGVCGVFVLRRRLEVDRNRTCFSSLLLAVEKERINWRKEAAHNAIDPHGRFRYHHFPGDRQVAGWCADRLVGLTRGTIAADPRTQSAPADRLADEGALPLRYFPRLLMYTRRSSESPG